MELLVLLVTSQLFVYSLCQASCNTGQFACQDYSCVSASARCDVVKDCPDNSDEQDCAPTCGCQDELKKLQEAEEQLKKSIGDLASGTQTGMQYGPCPTAQGWETNGKSCYKIVTSRTTWEIASDICTSYPNGHLAYVETSAEREYLLSQLKKHPSEAYFWLGGTDKKDENHWLWSPADITVQYANWYPVRPDNAAKIEHYMALYLNGQYEDLSHAAYLAYFCEVNIEP